MLFWALRDKLVMLLGFFDIGLVSLTAAGFACFGIFIWAKLETRKKPEENGDSGIVFVLSDDQIIDATQGAAALLARAKPHNNDQQALISLLTPTFGNVALHFDNADMEPVVIPATDGSAAWLNIVPLGGAMRITIGEHSKASFAQLNTVAGTRENAELVELRDVVRYAPSMMWHCDATGQLVWANDAYLTAADAIATTETRTPHLPNQPLFPDMNETIAAGTSSQRRALQAPDNSVAHWFDVTAFNSAFGTFYYATNADAAVKAEVNQRKFVQTLGQTFAQLSIGLAIFDRRRQLATFNPALLEMTGLNFEFLSGRPTLDMILDRLREERMLPEPKNYASWRDQFSAMEQDAKDGTYAEHWNLPNGQTFRVTGRPHPDGAFALLFEDITAEISLTRRFRSEIETGQAVLDHLDDAVVVFSGSGNLVMANAAYSALWGTCLNESLLQHDLRLELRKWQDRCTPTRIWTNLREFSNQMGQRKAWTDAAIMDDGRHITCRADPIAGGMTLIRFTFERPLKPSIQKLTQHDPALMAAKR